MRLRKILISILLMSLLLTACVKKVEHQEKAYLYPAFEIKDNNKYWGYIDPEGDFKVEAKYTRTYDYLEEGYALVEHRGKFGVLNPKGEEIIPPVYLKITDLNKGYFSCYDGENLKLIDHKGQVIFRGDEKISHFGNYVDGLIPFVKDLGDSGFRSGYMNNKGEIEIEASYFAGYDFHKGLAFVKTDPNTYGLINKKNELIKKVDIDGIAPTRDMDYLIYEKDGKKGVISYDGEFILENDYEHIADIKGDLALAMKDNKGQVINLKGQDITPEGYSDFLLLGEDLVAYSENGLDYGFMDSDGKILTEIKYKRPGGLEARAWPDGISVVENGITKLVDRKGNKIEFSPEIEGFGEIRPDKKVFRVNIEGRLSQYDRKGRLIWEEENVYDLKPGIRAKERNLTKGKGNISYPEINGLKSKEDEDQLNNKLYEIFTDIEEEEDLLKYKVSYKIDKKDYLILLEQVIEKDYGSTSQLDGKTYHINMGNGRFYKLEDLFKKDVDYKEKLNKILKSKIEDEIAQGREHDLGSFKGIDDDQNFIIRDWAIDIYLSPDQLKSDTDLYLRFEILNDEIDDIIDKNSEFWWSYNIISGR